MAFQPLTEEQYNKARSSGFSHEKIMEFEKRRKAESAPAFSGVSTEPFAGVSGVQSTSQQGPSALGQVATGAIKGVGATVADLGRTGEFIANQTAGRVVSGLTGGGLVPLPKKDLFYSPESPTGAKIEAATTPSNDYQKIGYYGEKAAEFVSPFVGAKVASRIPQAEQVLSEVTPKMTPSKVRQAYERGRAGVSGLMKKVTIEPEESTKRAAKAVEKIVKPGATAAENSKRVHTAIIDEAKNLKAALKAQEVQPTLQPEELNNLFQTALKEIGEDPDLVLINNSDKYASLMFRKFQEFLPQGRQITADDILEARQRFDGWVESREGAKIFDPATQNLKSIVLRTLRQKMNKLVAEKAPDVAVQDSLAKQSAMYDALENLATKGPAEVGSTKFSRLISNSPLAKTVLERYGLPGGIASGLITSKLLGDK